jgi:hypothetical protein
VLRDPSVIHDKELPDDTCELGYRYPRGAFASGQQPSTSTVWQDPHYPSIRIGAMLPHVLLHDNSRPSIILSTLDLVKKNFVLLVGGEFSSWQDASLAQHVQIDVYEISENASQFVDPKGEFKAVYQLGIGEAILVRPDGLVAWRGRETDEQKKATMLKVILEQVLGF